MFMFLSFIFMYILSCPSSSGRLPGSILAIPSTALFCAKLRYLSWSLHTQFGVYCPMSSDYHSDYCSLTLHLHYSLGPWCLSSFFRFWMKSVTVQVFLISFNLASSTANKNWKSIATSIFVIQQFQRFCVLNALITNAPTLLPVRKQ